MSVPTEVESLISGVPLSAHLATAVEDRPHVAPVWYGYRDGTLYLLTGGKKLANVRRNPRVAVAIEDATDGDVAWTVTMLGTATVSDDPERMAWAEEWVYDAYDDGATDPDADARTDGGEDEYALVEVEIGSVAWSVYE